MSQGLLFMPREREREREITRIMAVYSWFNAIVCPFPVHSYYQIQVMVPV
jgi:hypothetical protein